MVDYGGVGDTDLVSSQSLKREIFLLLYNYKAAQVIKFIMCGQL